MRIALFRAMTQRVVVILYRRFGTTYRSYIEGSSIQVQSYLLRGESLACLQEINKINHLTPNGHYMGRTAQLTSRCYI